MRAASKIASNSPADIYNDLVRLVLDAPKPDPRPPGKWTRDDQRHVIAPAIAWGWLMRVVRSGQAVSELEGRGFGSESAPLVRAALEHAIRLLWAAEYGDEFVEVALIAQKKGYASLQEAQTVSWQFDPNFADALEERASEASDDYKSLATYTALRHIVDSSPARLGSLYMGWLFDTQESHPSVLTAQAYYQADESGMGYKLFEKPKFSTQATLKSCFALVGAIDGYAKIAGLSEHIDSRLQAIIQRLPSRTQD